MRDLGRDGAPAEAPGRWLTDPASLARVGVARGTVDPDELRALMEGRRPDAGEPAWLRAAGPDGTRAGGIDITCSAPKSVSIAWALGDQRAALEAAHHAAVVAAVGYLRETVDLTVRYDAAAGSAVPARAAYVHAASFMHTTARGVGEEAPDPQLHSHVVLTSVEREDGSVAAVRSRPVLRAAREFRAKHGREPERGELRDLAVRTRERKSLPRDRGELDRVWERRGLEAGVDREVVEALRAAGPTASAVPDRDRWAQRVEVGVTARRAVFDAAGLRTVALEQAAGHGLKPQPALVEVDELRRDDRVLDLADGRMTTARVREAEREIEEHVGLMASDASRAIGVPALDAGIRSVEARLAASLRVEQREAVKTIIGPGRAAVLIGPAGTGKGVVIDAAAHAERAAGREVWSVVVAALHPPRCRRRWPRRLARRDRRSAPAALDRRRRHVRAHRQARADRAADRGAAHVPRREPASTTAARLVRSALAERGARLEAARHGARRRAERKAAPPWLPPAARADAIAALRDRYPAEPRHLPADPLHDPIIAEPLAALTVWRDELDDGAHADPRMEIAFAHELRSFAAWLQTQARRHQ